MPRFGWLMLALLLRATSADRPTATRAALSAKTAN
jgi:hypothetical protein